MKTFAILLALVVAVSANPFVNREEILVRYINGKMVCRENCGRRFADCPPANCVQPPANRVCPRPDCSQGVNRQFVFPSADPTTFYQCNPVINTDGSFGFVVLERPCGCQTYFSYERQACVHINEWTSDCNATPSPPPPPRVCIVECPTC